MHINLDKTPVVITNQCVTGLRTPSGTSWRHRQRSFGAQPDGIVQIPCIDGRRTDIDRELIEISIGQDTVNTTD